MYLVKLTPQADAPAIPLQRHFRDRQTAINEFENLCTRYLGKYRKRGNSRGNEHYISAFNQDNSIVIEFKTINQ